MCYVGGNISRAQWFDLILKMHRRTPDKLTVARIRMIRSRFEIPLGTRPNYRPQPQGRLLKDVGGKKKTFVTETKEKEKTEADLERERKEQEEAVQEMKRLEEVCPAHTPKNTFQL